MKKIPLLDKLKEWQKITIAAVCGILILGSSVFAYNWYFNPGFRSRLQPQETASAETNKSVDLSQLKRTLDRMSVENILYQNVKITDLPIYPISWVERNFADQDRRNALISGPSADPDRDGLSNKEEYFFGSNPKNPDTLCNGQKEGQSQESGVVCRGLNDRQNVEANISPLTGLELDVPRQFKILQQDLSVIQGLQQSFETASREGVDFPVLYQLSRKIDLSGEFKQIQVKELEDETQNVLDYRQLRTEIIRDFISENELGSLSQIYQVTRWEQFDQIKAQYQGQLSRLENAGVPKKFAQIHRSYILIFRKLIALVEHRQQGFKENLLQEESFRLSSQAKAVEMVWGYRRLNEESLKLEAENS